MDEEDRIYSEFPEGPGKDGIHNGRRLSAVVVRITTNLVSSIYRGGRLAGGKKLGAGATVAPTQPNGLAPLQCALKLRIANPPSPSLALLRPAVGVLELPESREGGYEYVQMEVWDTGKGGDVEACFRVVWIEASRKG